MFFTDVGLSVAQAAIAVLYLVVGVLLTMHPANTLPRKVGYWAAFGLLSIASVWLVYVQAKRSEAAQARSEVIQSQNQKEIARLQGLIDRGARDISGAIRDLRANPASAADKAARKALRRSLTEFLLRGEKLRRSLSEELDSPMASELGVQLAAVSKWDKELEAHVRANLGEERAAEIRAKTPSGTYPSGPYFPEAQTAWDALHSNMTEIRRLLREYPEL